MIDQSVNYMEVRKMKREEKIQLTRRRIMDSALKEFSECGYAASSVNNICAAEDISKGIIYHYFDSKDALFLACVEECFRLLTEHIRTNIRLIENTVELQLENYFTARMIFFKEHPLYQRIFCEAVITPPSHLKAEIQAKKQEFDELNIQIMEKLLESLPLRTDITKMEAIDTFHQFQDFINARYQMAEVDTQEFEKREQICRRALNILLYGIIERKETHNV